MHGPLPTGSRFLQSSIAKCYGTPNIFVATQTVGPKGFTQGARFSSNNFVRIDYLGYPLPFNSSRNVRRTSIGPLYVTPVSYGLSSEVELFTATDMLGTLSGVHDIAALISTTDALFTITADSTLRISPNIRGFSAPVVSTIEGDSDLSFLRDIVSQSSGIGSIADDSNSVCATLAPMIGQCSTLGIADASESYLFIKTVTVGPLTLAPCLAW